MLDSYGREINYLRISVTDKCNMRCMYCMPSEGVTKKEHEQIISFEDIENVVRGAVNLGIHKFRITGGEPLVRKGIVELVRNLANINGVKELVMTTNGAFLSDYAKDLKDAGLNRINISIDSFFEEKYDNITRGGDINKVFEGIAAAKNAGFSKMKYNVVLMKGFNDDEIFNFAQLTLNEDVDIRFIELMPIGENSECPYGFMPVSEAKERFQGLIPIVGDKTEKGVAENYRLPGAIGKIGFISPLSRHFCEECNKIRLTCDGKIKPCLHSNKEIDIKGSLATKDLNEIEKALKSAILQKDEKHYLNEGADPIDRNMNQIGG